MPGPAIVGRMDPYTVVIIPGIRLPAYAVGGVNISVGELARVAYAEVNLAVGGEGQTSGWTPSIVGSAPITLWAASGSGNIVTIFAMRGGLSSNARGIELEAGAPLSGFPVTVKAWGY